MRGVGGTLNLVVLFHRKAKIKITLLATAKTSPFSVSRRPSCPRLCFTTKAEDFAPACRKTHRED